MIQNYTVHWAVYGTFLKSFWTSALTLFAYSTWRDTAHMHQWSFLCNLMDINAPHLSWNCNLLTLHPETSSLHRSRSIIKECKPLRTWLNMEGPSSLNRALEHSLQHLLLCMHRSSALAAVPRILGFRLGFVGRL
jgi:hypothetical protein